MWSGWHGMVLVASSQMGRDVCWGFSQTVGEWAALHEHEMCCEETRRQCSSQLIFQQIVNVRQLQFCFCISSPLSTNPLHPIPFHHTSPAHYHSSIRLYLEWLIQLVKMRNIEKNNHSPDEKNSSLYGLNEIVHTHTDTALVILISQIKRFPLYLFFQFAKYIFSIFTLLIGFNCLVACEVKKRRIKRIGCCEGKKRGVFTPPAMERIY